MFYLLNLQFSDRNSVSLVSNLKTGTSNDGTLKLFNEKKDSESKKKIFVSGLSMDEVS